MIRPEVVRVFPPQEAPDGAIAGRIVQTYFLGSETRVAVDCDARDVAMTVAQFGRERIAAGDLSQDKEVAIWWEPDDAVLLPIESSEEEG